MNRFNIAFIVFVLCPTVAYAGSPRGPHSISFFGGFGIFHNSPYFDASSNAGLGDGEGVVVNGKARYEYRLNPDWAIGLDIPYIGGSSWTTFSPYETLPDERREVGHDILYGLVPRYFFIDNGKGPSGTMDAYVGAGPIYADIFEMRPPQETREKKWGLELSVGYEFFYTFLPKSLGVSIEAQYWLFPDISTPLGNLNVSGPSIMAGFRYHFGG